MPRLLADIIKGVIASQRDFALVGEVSSEDELLPSAIKKRANVVIVGALVKPKSKDVHDLLYCCPRMKIISIAPHGSNALLHEMQPHAIRLDDVSPATLIAAIRGFPDADGAAFERS